MFPSPACRFLATVTGLVPVAAQAQVLIHEVFADGNAVDANCDGVVLDSTDEFVELVHAGGPPVSLDGAVLEDGTAVRHVFAPGTSLVAGQAVVVFAGGAPRLDGSGADPWCAAVPDGVRSLVASTGALGLNNAGDTVALRAGDGAVLAQVSFGDADGGESLVRQPELTEGVLVPHGEVSPRPVSPGTRAAGGPLDAPPEAPEPATPGVVVINEVLVDPAGEDAGAEWVELVSRSDRPTDLSGWTLERAKSEATPWAAALRLPEGLVLAPGEIVLLGDPGIGEADVILMEGDTLDLGNGEDAARIVDATGGVVDTLVYGGANPDGWPDDDELVASTAAPRVPQGESIARAADGVDTQDCGLDFVACDRPTPGAPNACGGPADTAAPPTDAGPSPVRGLVLINELLPDPDGADSGREWVELKNVGPEAIELGDWVIERAKSATTPYGARFRFPAGALEAGEHLVIGEAEVEGADHLAGGLDLGSGAGGDAVRLLDALGRVVDTVVYGDGNVDGFADDAEAPARSVAPPVGAGESLARVPDGLDSDRAGTDFRAGTPTPGEVNQGSGGSQPGLACDRVPGLRLNEVLPNPEGSDEGRDWVELFHGGARPVSLGGWRLGAEWESAVVLTDAAVGPGDWAVVGSEAGDVEVVPGLVLVSGDGSPRLLRLWDCEGQLVDSVIYGDAGELLPDDRGSLVASYGSPGEGESLARRIDGADGDRAEDWRVALAPSPGATNALERGSGVSVGCGPGRAHHHRGPSSAAPGADAELGCRTGRPGPWWWAAILVGPAILSRRRRGAPPAVRA